MTKRSHGEGCIYERKDERWVALISLEDGKRKSIYRHTKAEAIMALQLAQQAKIQGTLTSTREETVKDFLQDWLQYRVQPRVRPRTFLIYQDQVNKHLLPSLGHIKLQRLTAMHVQKLYHQKQQDGLSAQMIVQIHKVLRMALNDAILLNHLSRNICQAVQVPHPSRSCEIHPLTAEQARRFLAALQGDPLEAFYVLALMTGMRRGELLGLIWSHVDLEVGKLHVCQSLTRLPHQGLVMTALKTQTSRRCIQLTSQAIEALKRHRQRQADERQKAGSAWVRQNLVFCSAHGKPLDAANLLSRSFQPLLTKAGLDRIRFHDLRHTTATLLLTMGTHPKVVQELLGHSRISMTLDLYSHVIPSLQEETMQRFSSYLTPL